MGNTNHGQYNQDIILIKSIFLKSIYPIVRSTEKNAMPIEFPIDEDLCGAIGLVIKD